MAPEVILEKGYGKPIDWWSSGITLHEFLVGCVPFRGNTKKEVYKKIIDGGANEIKLHPFLWDVEFDNILNQEPEYVPQLVSDMDTSHFETRSEIFHHILSEEEEDTKEDND